MEFDLLGSLDPQRPAADAAPPRPAESAPGAVCSRRGCQSPARWALLWNNPRVHTPERRKAWLACDEHREHLADFLGQRGFLKSVEPFEEDGDDAAAPSPSETPGLRQAPGPHETPAGRGVVGSPESGTDRAAGQGGR